MNQGELRIMLPSTMSPAGQPRIYSPYEARPEYASRATHPHVGHHRPMDRPQPLEPHSGHQFRGPQVQDATPRHVEANGYRPSGQTLPGLRDIILTPNSHTSPQPPQSAWSQPPPVPRYEQRNPEPAGAHPNGLHQPHNVQPSSEPHGAYSQPPDRRLDLPILDTQPVARHQASGPPIPHYANHHADNREAMEGRYERPRQTSASSYMTAGAPSPYTPLTGEHHAHRNSNASYDRSGNPPFTPTGPEASKKYLGIKDFPGEGTFHVYDGGYRIPTSVDGETVNPQWGLTKANKPRKRLALACLDCREKKIKCEPGASSCLQCEKAKRPCRRAQNQTLTTDSAGNPQWTSEAGSPPLAPHSQPVERMQDLNIANHRPSDPATTKNNRLSDGDPFAKRRAQDDESTAGAPVKRHQSMSPATAYGNANSGHQQRYPPYMSNRLSGISKGSFFMSWEDDPFYTDPESTIHLVEVYFANVNSATYCIFPRITFMNWLTTNRDKCQNERMVLYAMLAMGSTFAGPSYGDIGRRCADLATDGLSTKVGRFSLPVIHVRLLLSLYNFSKGNEGAAWEYCGLAIRALSALRYNHEEGCMISPKKENPILEYGLTREQVMECRRRTFWAGFLMDRYNGFCGGMLCVINPADIYLRLPSADDAYESSMSSVAPFYDNGTIDGSLATLNASSPVAPMAWLAVVAGIWGEAMNFIYRATNHHRNTYRQAYEKVYNETHDAMRDWNSRLPGYLRYSEANLDRSIQDGYAGTFISIHVLHHFVLMKLNRCMRHTLAGDLAPRNIRAAHHHAHSLLGIMHAIREARREILHPQSGQPSRFALSVPFAGYATLSAVDIVGGGGPDSTLGPTMNGMESGVDCLRELAQFWNSAVEQTKSAERRHYQLKNVLSRPYKASSGCWLGQNWGLEGPIEQEFELEADCIYGVDNKVYFSALEDAASNGRARA